MKRLLFFTLMLTFVSCEISMKPLDEQNPDNNQDRDGRGNGDLTVRISLEEKEIFDEVNDYRENNGLTKLKWINQAVIEAQLHSDFMDNYNEVNSTGLARRVNSIAVKEDVDIRANGENVGLNKSVSEILSVWKANRVQRQKLLGDYTHTGVGVTTNGDKKFFTQIFIQISN